MSAQSAALSVKNLTTEIRVRGTWHQAVRDLSFDVAPRETVALVGESGCGKSLSALSIMQLLPAGVGRVASGTIALDGDIISSATPSEMESIRGDRIVMVVSDRDDLQGHINFAKQLLERTNGAVEREVLPDIDRQIDQGKERALREFDTIKSLRAVTKNLRI